MNLMQGSVEGFADYLIRTVGFEQLNWKGSMSKLDETDSRIGLLYSRPPKWTSPVFHYGPNIMSSLSYSLRFIFFSHNLLGWKN